MTVDMKLYAKIAFIVLIIGGINAGLMGLFGINIIFSIFGNLLSRLIYIIIGVAAGFLCYDYYKKGGMTS